jgi:hypothetical protein
MNRQNFKFNGNWEYDIELPSMSGFRDGGLFKLIFEDDLSDNPDPYVEQLNTLDYIFDNQEIICELIINRTLAELEQIIPDYGLENEAAYQNLDRQKVRSLIGISSIVIKIVAKDGFSYFDISGGCNWDEEHGLNILFHKDRIISFGGIDGGSTYDAEKDNGTFNKDSNRHLQREKPKRYLPHPKYNQLKPSQIAANETYEYTLISYGYNDDFIKGVENGEIEVNGKWISQDKTYLEAACWFKNNELVEYLLSKKAEIRYALHQCVGYGNNPEALEMLLQHGAAINTQDKGRNTILFELVNTLVRHYRSNQENVESLKAQISDLIKRGADPYIRNVYGHSCFDIMRNSDERSGNELRRFLTDCLSNK